MSAPRIPGRRDPWLLVTAASLVLVLVPFAGTVFHHLVGGTGWFRYGPS